MGKYQILEHTADKGLAVEAESLPDLFETAARGLFRLMIDPDQYPPTETVAIELHAPDLEMLLVKWLNELLYHFEVHHRLFSRYERIEAREADGRWRLDGAGALLPDCAAAAGVGRRAREVGDLSRAAPGTRFRTLASPRLRRCLTPCRWRRR
jgi:SHS2 domain-containing protein